MINANAMPTQKKILGVGGELDKPHLQDENAVESTVAWLRTDFSLFICSPINANAIPKEYQSMPTLCQRKKGQDWEISLRSGPDSPRWIPDLIGTSGTKNRGLPWSRFIGLSDRRSLRPTVGVNAGVQCMV